MPLTDEELAALWVEHDRLRREIEKLDRQFRLVNDRLMADLEARTGFPRAHSEATP